MIVHLLSGSSYEKIPGSLLACPRPLTNTSSHCLRCLPSLRPRPHHRPTTSRARRTTCRRPPPPPCPPLLLLVLVHLLLH